MILHCTVLHFTVTYAYRSTVYVYPFVVIQEGIHLVESQPLEHIAERAFLYYREVQYSTVQYHLGEIKYIAK